MEWRDAMITPPVADAPTASATVLVVDDEPALCQALRMILELEGHRVRTAPDGVAALAAATQEPPAVVLLDLVMPQMDGYQTEAALHALLPAVPVIFMSTRDRVWQAAADHPAAGALPKPFDVDLVLDTVARFLPPAAPRA
jgi:two-component system response regulator MprA